MRAKAGGGSSRYGGSYAFVFALAALAIGLLYLWCAQAANGPFDFKSRGGGFYNLLAHGFASGHLYVPVDPAPQLLALPDPWDPTRNGEYGMQDMALYNRRYYVYHGATPALILFTPWLLATGRDLPESFAAFLFCFLGYLCWCGTLLRVLWWLKVRPAPPLLALLLIALGVCQSAPFLLQRVMVYEVAIAGGYFAVSAGFWLLARAVLAPRTAPGMLAMSGLMLGLAIGCRPHLAFAALCGGVMLYVLSRKGATVRTRDVVAFTVPVVACVLLLGYYNYARFRDPLEFGMRYELASPTYFRPLVSFANFRAGLYYLFACPPDLDPVFPFFRLIMRTPFELPKRYFLEPIAGCLLFSPLALGALVLPSIVKRWRDRRAAALTNTISLSAAAAAGTIATLGLISQRYEVDFLPSFLFGGCLLIALVEADAAIGNRVRAILRVLLGGALMFSMGAGLALGIQGPYDEFVQKHPAAYAKLARWFSPMRRYRPVQNPRLTVESAYVFPATMGTAESPLIGAGRFGTRYLLSEAPLGGNRLRLNASTTLTAGVAASADVALIPGVPNRVRLEYDPQKATMTVDWNGATVLRHPLPSLITAPAQITIGEDHTGIDTWPGHFAGAITAKSVRMNGVEYR